MYSGHLGCRHLVFSDFTFCFLSITNRCPYTYLGNWRYFRFAQPPYWILGVPKYVCQDRIRPNHFYVNFCFLIIRLLLRNPVLVAAILKFFEIPVTSKNHKKITSSESGRKISKFPKLWKHAFSRPPSWFRVKLGGGSCIRWGALHIEG